MKDMKFSEAEGGELLPGLPTRADIDKHTASQIEKGNYSPLEACGLLCPEPVMLLHKLIKQVNGGDLIKVSADDPSTLRDIPRFCEFLKHDLLAAQQYKHELETRYEFWIKKRV